LKKKFFGADLMNNCSRQTTRGNCNFSPRQILCLEHRYARLYAEAIEIVPERDLCWARPLILEIGTPGSDLVEYWDLREGADLLWPQTLFRLAIDEEAIPILSQLQEIPSRGSESFKIVRQKLEIFIHEVWEERVAYFRREK